MDGDAVIVTPFEPYRSADDDVDASTMFDVDGMAGLAAYCSVDRAFMLMAPLAVPMLTGAELPSTLTETPVTPLIVVADADEVIKTDEVNECRLTSWSPVITTASLTALTVTGPLAVKATGPAAALIFSNEPEPCDWMFIADEDSTLVVDCCLFALTELVKDRMSTVFCADRYALPVTEDIDTSPPLACT